MTERPDYFIYYSDNLDTITKRHAQFIKSKTKLGVSDIRETEKHSDKLKKSNNKVIEYSFSYYVCHSWNHYYKYHHWPSECGICKDYLDSSCCVYHIDKLTSKDKVSK